MKRGRWTANADIISSNAGIDHPGPLLVFVLKGRAEMNGAALGEGDTAIDADHVALRSEGVIYVARLKQE